MQLAFQSKTSDRWSDDLTPAGVLDMALRGTREQWWELYHAARGSQELRSLLARQLPKADPDLAPGVRLWLAILARLESDPRR